MLNKKAGYHQRTLRLAIFVKEAFEKMNTFFSRKLSYFIVFSKFSNVQNFPKNPIN